LNDREYIEYSEKFQAKLYFSGQAQVAQKPELWKKFQYRVFSRYSLSGDSFNLG